MQRVVAGVLLLLPAFPVAAAIDTIIPMPKSIREVGDPVLLSGFRIVAADTRRARIGASEINLHIRELGDEPLPVLDLESFLDKWVTGMTDDGISPAVFPTLQGLGVVVEPTRLAEDLQEEMEQYE